MTDNDRKLTESLSVTHKHSDVQTSTDLKRVTHIHADGHADGGTDRELPHGRSAETYQDFVLPGEVWRLTEQLSVGHGKRTRRIPNQHRVIEPGSA